MVDITSTITYLLSIGTVIVDLFIIFAVFLILIKEKLPDFIDKAIQKFWLHISLIISLGASLASFYYSEIAKFEPCTLCWYQRSFMFPLVFLFGLAIYRKETFIKPYVKLMAILGSLIAIYHYLLQIGVTTIAPCSLTVNGVSACVQRPFIAFGYITIPIMSLTSFLLILVILKLSENSETQ
ncbi:MAG: disulfide bond formation protein B [bacterium]|nr:disulfide bond formation protein B [bacterium]